VLKVPVFVQSPTKQIKFSISPHISPNLCEVTHTVSCIGINREFSVWVIMEPVF
jgi:hypothetical protein